MADLLAGIPTESVNLDDIPKEDILADIPKEDSISDIPKELPASTSKTPQTGYYSQISQEELNQIAQKYGANSLILETAIPFFGGAIEG